MERRNGIIKLYATIQNEKGKAEGIGGNEQLTIAINRGNRRMVEFYLTVEQLSGSNELVVIDMLNLSDANVTRVYEYQLNHTLPEYKQAKKQKGKCWAQVGEDYCSNNATKGDYCDKHADMFPL